jgi:hypothetical protein
MKVYPKYAENIIVGVVHAGAFGRYVSDKTYWILDLNNLEAADAKKGHRRANDHDPLSLWRFGIKVVDESSAAAFLDNMRDYAADCAQLQACMITAVEYGDKEDLIDCRPSLLVDFDARNLESLYPEYESFETYVPDGWSGSYTDFLDKIPEECRYWVINGHDVLRT